MRFTKFALAVAGAGLACACSPSSTTAGNAADTGAGDTVSIRNLAETEVARPAREPDRIAGRLIPTPSDSGSRYYLLRERKALTDTHIAIIRQEHAGRVAYARAEVDCDKRLFHVLGTGPNRALVETNIAHDGPLRPIKGLPLREELARYVCEVAGTPLKAA
ncbi:hypothetical protein FSB78_06240 [Sphingomonas ginsenosidivorax]|uniref:Lipoprotein n=1 Tax=Sphingomonas ginsenosidivorax TaxID=862135 RepID=A0A5C6UCZ1_9SPHN|nr:hypothetical protein [Sphingomonas ginsenosidivorax]TXC70582.1 hypothetical protein FSB78_06240 [Sphingomonas ginsenosidivorax]